MSSSYRSLIDLLAGTPAPKPSSWPRNSLASLLAGTQPPPVPKPETENWIWFQGLPFAGPTPLALAPKYNWGGLYAIMVLDVSGTPRPYRVIYIGESGDMAQRVGTSHEKFASWVRVAGSASRLHVAFHTIANQAERRAAESRLIAYYKPECNDTFNAFYGLFGSR